MQIKEATTINDSQRQPFTVGFLGIMGIVSACLILMYGTTFKEASNILMTAMLMLTVGLFLAFILVGVKFDRKSLRFFETFLWTAMSLGAMLVVNNSVPFTLGLSLSPIDTRLFSVLMGVVEECFFRVFLCGFVYRLTTKASLAIGISSIVWTVYHINRYGGSPASLMVVFVCGCILGASFIYSRCADNTILAHGCVNFLA